MANIGNGRALHVCDVCGGVDDHPRHQFAGTVDNAFALPSEQVIQAVLDNAPPEHQARLLRDLWDTGSTDRHMDCCRERGCPDGSCDEQTKGAESKRGAALVKHLTKGA